MILITTRKKINIRIQNQYKLLKYNNLYENRMNILNKNSKYYNLKFFMETEAIIIVSIFSVQRYYKHFFPK